MSVFCDCCVLSRRGRSPTECFVTECDREASTIRRPWRTRGCRAMGVGVGVVWEWEKLKELAV